MKHPLALSSLLLGALHLMSAPSAWPCSLAPRADDAKLEGVVGPNPLLFSGSERPNLSGPLGQSVELVGIPAPAAFGAVKGAYGGTLFFFRAESPLGEGDYQIDQSSFTVSSSAADEIPALGARGKVELYLADEGSGGMCGDTSNLLIDLLDLAATDQEHALLLVQFERSDGTSFSRLVSVQDRFESTLRFRFYHSFHETGHLRTEKLCVKISGVSPTGSLGPGLDLGCVDPNDETDPRVFRGEGAGCSTSGPSRGLSGVWILLGGFLFARFRRRIRA